jgi:hypothetical protein
VELWTQQTIRLRRLREFALYLLAADTRATRREDTEVERVAEEADTVLRCVCARLD